MFRKTLETKLADDKKNAKIDMKDVIGYTPNEQFKGQ